MKSNVLGAGFFCISLAIFVQGLLPIAIPESRETRATRAVRNDLGEIRWVWYESSPYTPLEQLGRNVYQREGCWYCHSQYVRPVTGEDQRWGPVSQVGEYAHDREPEVLVPDSIMPEFAWLFRTATAPVVDKDGAPALGESPGLKALFSFKEGVVIPLYPNPEGLAFAERTDGRPALEVKSLPESYDKPETWKGKTLTIVV